MPQEAKYPVKTTQKTFDIVEELEDRGTTGVTELADALEMNKSIVHNHLRTLVERGYVVTEGDEYRLGFRFLKLGSKTRKECELYQLAKKEVDNIALETSGTANLAIEEDGMCVTIYQARDEKSIDVQFAYEGKYDYMHTTAVGKAILAFLPPERIHEIIDKHGLPSKTTKTIDDEETLLEELEEVREREYAVDNEESVQGLRCVGAPIRTAGGTVLGSISVSGPRSHFKGETWTENLPDLVRDMSNVIELRIFENSP